MFWYWVKEGGSGWTLESLWVSVSSAGLYISTSSPRWPSHSSYHKRKVTDTHRFLVVHIQTQVNEELWGSYIVNSWKTIPIHPPTSVLQSIHSWGATEHMKKDNTQHLLLTCLQHPRGEDNSTMEKQLKLQNQPGSNKMLNYRISSTSTLGNSQKERDEDNH